MVSETGVAEGVDVDVLEDIAGFIASSTGEEADLGALQRAAAQDPDVPVGEVLQKAPLAQDGSAIKWTKRDTMVRAGDKPLPERFAAYGRDNTVSMLPTAQMAYHLTKPAADGRPAFRIASKGPWPGVPIPEPIEDLTCDFCNNNPERNPAKGPKRFWRKDQVEPHMRAAHTQSYDAMLRIEREEREKQAQETNQKLLEAQLAQLDLMRNLMEQGRTDDALDVAQGAGIDTTPVEEAQPVVQCEDCGWVSPTGKMQGLQLHRRRWCPEKDRLV